MPRCRLTVVNQRSRADAGFLKGGGSNLGLHAKKGASGSSFEPNVRKPT